ncbi:MAG TPA: hypothetical protein VM686_25810 [Polyangiaceae bacterium]|nr:hypothetical protein [Polyangiaceae bacterium]
MTCCSHGGPPPPREAASSSPSACDELPLFRVYEEHGASHRRSAHRLELDLPVDLHSLDCGAPDSYGHEMTLTLVLGSVADRCVIEEAFAVGKAYGPPGFPSGSWKNTFTVTGAPDLASADLQQVELRDPTRREALLLLGTSYYFYAGVVDGGRLKPELIPEEASDCCYGFTSAEALRWSYPSP